MNHSDIQRLDARIDKLMECIKAQEEVITRWRKEQLAELFGLFDNEVKPHVAHELERLLDARLARVAEVTAPDLPVKDRTTFGAIIAAVANVFAPLMQLQMERRHHAKAINQLQRNVEVLDGNFHRLLGVLKARKDARPKKVEEPVGVSLDGLFEKPRDPDRPPSRIP
jgi:hypothetical protein